MRLNESTVSKVQELDLKLNGIDTDGAQAIAALCSSTASLTRLDVGYNSLGEEAVLRKAAEGRSGFELKL
jgi:hypothetical protein